LPVASAIRSNNLIALGDAILTGKSEGMNVLDEALILQYRADRITGESAIQYATDHARMRAALNQKDAAAPATRPR
jgi:Tfp pilus assembly pilus retraction ATPase PilT